MGQIGAAVGSTGQSRGEIVLVSSCRIMGCIDRRLRIKRMRRPGDPDRCLWDDGVALCGPVRDLEDLSRSPGVVREIIVGNPGFGRGRVDRCHGP